MIREMVSASVLTRQRHLSALRLGNWRFDAASVLLLLLLSAVASFPLLWRGTVVGLDSADQFYPRYLHLGDSLRSADIPGWMPYQFSGAPFAGDPQSGWMYLPAMVLFTLLPLNLAAKSYVFLHLVLAGLAAYSLARLLGMSIAGALTVAVAYEFSGLMFERSPTFFTHTGVAAWLPVAILGVELAIRSRGWMQRGLWWGVSGLALSQVLAIWLGQGSYYVLLVLGGYVAYRALVAPPEGTGGARARVTLLVLHGGAVLLFGFGLGAAGVLPRLEYNGVSNLANGYTGTNEAVAGGWSLAGWWALLRAGRGWYAGGAALALALVAPLVARGRHATPYWAVMSVCALLLTGQGPTPLHLVLSVLPSFSTLHAHYPQMVLMVFYLGPALLAGATVSSISARGSRAALVAAVPLVGLLVALVSGITISIATATSVVLASVLMAACALLGARRQLAFACVSLLVLVVFVDLLLSGQKLIDRHMHLGEKWPALRKVDLTSFYRPTEAGEFLVSRSRSETFRYLGFDTRREDSRRNYPSQWRDRRAAMLLANNRATVLHLQDLQGYNPVHIARYDDLMRAINEGRGQSYRRSQVYSEGLDSPLLDLLNTRYLVVPASGRPASADIGQLLDGYPVIYQNKWVRVLERRSALPRAWVVHNARQVPSGEALKLLATREIDPRRTVLLEESPPPLSLPAQSAVEKVSISEYTADRIRLRSTTAAPGMLVLSEIHYPAWKAYVDGRPAALHVANHALRALHVGAGDHEVELRFESSALAVGTWISAFFYLLLATIAGLSVRYWWKCRPPPDPALQRG
ncbi:MAG: hypothetical protein M3Q29_21410 [Chloroflexota bacterium]|nr:hypothetical protein [Chloroflexota bacterium]